MRILSVFAMPLALGACSPSAPAPTNVTAPSNVAEPVNLMEPANLVEKAEGAENGSIAAMGSDIDSNTGLPAELAQAIESGGADLAVECAAHLAHRLDSASAPEKPALKAAMKAWRARLDSEMTKDEAAQYFASTWAVLRDASPAGLEAAANYCTAHLHQG